MPINLFTRELATFRHCIEKTGKEVNRANRLSGGSMAFDRVDHFVARLVVGLIVLGAASAVYLLWEVLT